MRALRSCDFCGEQAVGTFEVIPDELDPTEAERRRVMLCDSCKETLQTLIEPLIERAGGPTGSEAAESSDTAEEAGSNDLIESNASDDGSLLGEQSDSEETDTTEGADTDDETNADASGSAPASDGQIDGRPENYGKVLKLLRNREFPMTREEVVTIATSAYQLDARNVQAVIDEAIDRGEFREANGQLQHA
jgi:hypothetical protein